MSSRIPEDVLEQIKKGIDIADVVGEYVQLKKQGRNYFGLCPFHGEKSPSFSVSPDKQIYHCFGCGAGGNAFTFLMEMESMSFQEAAAALAAKANIELDVPAASTEPVQKGVHEDLLEAHELLAKFFKHLLLNTEEGKEAKAYLMERGVTLEDIERFQIGWSLPQPAFAVQLLQKRGFTLERMEEAGLVIRQESTGDYFDRFRGRIMFPILNEQGRTAGFSGRTLDDSQPKYLNSPETPIFQKSRLLYHFSKAKPVIKKKKQVVLLEGYADVIAAVKAGFDESVAVMGTALTPEHVRVIQKLTDQAVICYDGDKAGQEAAFKAGRLLEEHQIHVKVAVLPDQMDPDEFVQRQGSAAFAAYVNDASLTFMAFKMVHFRRSRNLRDDEQKFQYIEAVLAEIAGLSKAVERDFYLRKLADECSISLQALQEQEKALFLRKRQSSKNREAAPKKAPAVERITERKIQTFPRHETAERRLIAHMLVMPELPERIRTMLDGDPFTIDEHQALFTYLLGFYEQQEEPDMAAFLSILPDEKLRRLAVDISFMTVSQEPGEAELNDYIKQVKNQHRRREIEEKKQARMEAEKRQDYVGAARLLRDIILLEKSLAR